MKTIKILIIALLFGTHLFSQDTLYTTEGKMIAGKVLEVTPDEIKYKQASNLDGPTYVINKSDVVLIEYKNGVKDIFPKTANTTSNSSQVNTNNSTPQTVYVNPRPSVRVIVTPQPFYGGWGWGAGWGYRSYGHYHGGHGHHGGHGRHR